MFSACPTGKRPQGSPGHAGKRELAAFRHKAPLHPLLSSLQKAVQSKSDVTSTDMSHALVLFSSWPGWRHECMMVSFLLLLGISVQKLRDFLIILREMVQQFEKMSFLKKLWKTPWSLCFLLLKLRLLCGHWCWGFIWVLWESYCSEECCEKSGAP